LRAPIDVRQGAWPRAVAGLADDPYAAALVANHALFAYDRFRGEAEWTAFFEKMESLRSSMLSVSTFSFEQLQADYAFVRLGDLISLAFCTGSTTEQSFRDWTVRLSGPRVIVTPGIFGGAPVTFEVAARAVRPPFHSDAELRATLGRASTTLIQGEAV
jgi:hypothetical protein